MKEIVQRQYSSRFETDPKNLSSLVSSKYKIMQVKQTKTIQPGSPRRKQRQKKIFQRPSKRKQRVKKEAHVQNILRDQKKKMYTQLFIKKLKQSIVRSQPVSQENLQANTKQQNADLFQGLQLGKIPKIIFNVASIIHIAFLLIYSSIALVFNNVSDSAFITALLIFSILMNLLEMGNSFVVQKNNDGKKLIKIRQISENYLKKRFVLDLIVLVVLWIDLFCNDQWQTWLRLFFLTKLGSLIERVEDLQITMVSTFYRQQYWALAKVFLFNFMFAHILAIFLVAMARLNEYQNWIITKQFNGDPWHEQYIWAYYWGTTTMLTVGFGDIAPTNTGQAICMIFIETFSTVVLAYNVNCVGNIISMIRSYDIEKNRDLKIFNQISQETKLQQATSNQITDYIRESVKIKRNYNIQQQKSFIQNLPNSFKNDLLQQRNRGVLKNLIFFKNLSQKMINYLAVKIEKKLSHPCEVISCKGELNEVIILNKGQYSYCYNKGNSVQNGSEVQKFKVGKNQFHLISLCLFFCEQIKFDVKCIDYTILYKIGLQDLISILQKNRFDYEYFMMVKQKDKYLTNEYQIHKCPICLKQKHTIFKCPKLHYVPLKQHIVNKYNLDDPDQTNVRRPYYYRDNPTSNTLLNFKELNMNIQNRRDDLINVFKSVKSLGLLKDQLDQINQNQGNQQNQHGQDMKAMRINTQLSNFRKKSMQFFDQVAQKMRDDLSRLVGDNSKSAVWQLDGCDSAYDFKFYFTSGNPSNIKSKFSLNYLKRLACSRQLTIASGEKSPTRSPLKRALTTQM